MLYLPLFYTNRLPVRKRKVNVSILTIMIYCGFRIAFQIIPNSKQGLEVLQGIKKEVAMMQITLNAVLLLMVWYERGKFRIS